MISTYSYFTTEILHKKHYSELGNEYEKTVEIILYDKHNNEIQRFEKGYMQTAEIYELIANQKDIDVSDCYIKNFSLTAYRRMQLLEKKSTVKIKSFIAINAFFDSEYNIDFSNAEFLNGNVNFNNACFENGNVSFNAVKFGDGNLDFSYCLFRNGNLDFANVTVGSGKVSFKNAIFKRGVKDFQNTDFGSGKKDFTNTEFGDGDVSFISTKFPDGDVSFKVARFGEGKVDFHFAEFSGGNISFERVSFGNGKIDFRTVEFGSGKLNFNRSEFGEGEVSFEASQKKEGKVSFKKTNFGKGNLSFEIAEYDNAELNFDRALFGNNEVTFYNFKSKTLSFKGCRLNAYFDLRLSHCELLDLSDTIVRDLIDLKPFEFMVDIDILNISGMRLLGRLYIDWKANNVFKIITNQKSTDYDLKAEQFRTLKENFSNTGRYDDEDKAYVWFKRYEMKAEMKESREKSKWSLMWKYPVHWFKQLIFDKAGLYATDPVRVMFSMVVSFVFFSLIYVLILEITKTGIVSAIGGEHDKLSLIGRSFYHSAITFLTIGYGDFYPFGVVRWISGIEGFVGLFLMSYFTVAFVRKILR
ncbi:MAG: two pore domain potassium channel family protein [Chlorobi bacterium]|nr:two pore domain potassium channel family protein [Chlorobiota bacterium]